MRHHGSMEQEKRIRREIANSNERRRMQSINAGFQSLRTLLPHHEGEKLSKVSIRVGSSRLSGVVWRSYLVYPLLIKVVADKRDCTVCTSEFNFAVVSDSVVLNSVGVTSFIRH